MADIDREARIAAIKERAEETETWIVDWHNGMFTPAHTRDGWTVEMHGLVASTTEHTEDIAFLLAERAGVERERDTLRETLLNGENDDSYNASVIAAALGILASGLVGGNE